MNVVAIRSGPQGRKEAKRPKSLEERKSLIIRLSFHKPTSPQRRFQFLRLAPQPLVGSPPHSPRPLREGFRNCWRAAERQSDFAGLIITPALFTAPLAFIDHVVAVSAPNENAAVIKLGDASATMTFEPRAPPAVVTARPFDRKYYPLRRSARP